MVIDMEDNKKKLILMGLILLILVLGGYLTFRQGYIYGGQKACHNTNKSILVDGFKCEPRIIVQRGYNLTEGVVFI